MSNLIEYWYLWLIFAVLLIVTVFVWKKAGAAAAKRFRRVNGNIAAARREDELSAMFSDVTEEAIANASDEDLIEGLALLVQKSVEVRPDLKAAFKQLPAVWREVYAVNVFVCDVFDKKTGKTTLSDFYRRNGEPLLTPAGEAVRSAGLRAAYGFIEKMRPMMDSDDESASFDENLVKSLDEGFAEAISREDFVKAAAGYFADRAREFAETAERLKEVSARTQS